MVQVKPMVSVETDDASLRSAVLLQPIGASTGNEPAISVWEAVIHRS